MRARIRRVTFLLANAVLMAAFSSNPAFAAVIQINQHEALEGKVTPGDTPGFPVTISRPGSYRLTGNLNVPLVTAIEVTSSDVMLDLNGFAIIGPNICTGVLVITCTASMIGADGIAVDSSSLRNVVVRNSTIRGMGGAAIALFGGPHVIERMNLHSNRGGIFVQLGTVAHVQAAGNEFNGIGVSIGRITDSVATLNGGTGLSLENGSATDNVVLGNLQSGVFFGAGAGYRGNILAGNVGGNIIGPGGVSLGHNLCSGIRC